MTQGLLAALSLDEKAKLTAGATMWATAALPQIGLEPINMADGPMGIASGRVDERDVSILTPSGIALGATWDRDIVGRIGGVVGQDARKLGVDLVLAPNLNLPRSPLAGRTFELFSEDPYLTGALGAAWITGLQAQGVGAVAKHVAGNDSETQRNSMNSMIDERALREVYLAPFEMASEAGSLGMLTAYNRLNGAYCAENAPVLSIIKDEWAFDGPLISDWFGTLDTMRSIDGRLDLEMPGPPRHFGPAYASAVREGKAREAQLDEAASRVLVAARKLGKLPGTSRPAQAPLSTAAIKTLLTEAAAAGFTLLKNDRDLLPLVPGTHKRIAVIGPNAAAPCYQGGTFAKIAVYPDTQTPWQSIEARYEGACAISFEPGVDPQPRLPSLPATPARDLGDGCAKGLTVDYFIGHDFSVTPHFSETRNTNSLTWFAGMHDAASDFKQPGGVRACGLFTPASSGAHIFYAGATGPVRLTIDGKEVFRSDAEVKPSDIMGVLKSGDAESVVVDLEAGKPVLVAAELRYNPARAHGLWYGVRSPDKADAMFARAVDAAKNADAVILIVGETQDAGVESKDRTSTKLPDEQLRLIDAVCEANANTAIIANVGHAFDASFAEKAAAFMVAWYPGQEFGPAIAAVLAGDLEPGGRLPVTFAQRDEDYPAFDLTPDANGDLPYEEGWLIGYRSFVKNNIAPLYALGKGQGYARFSLDGVRHQGDVGSGVQIEVEVRNITARAGKEVLQAYVTLPGQAHGAPMLKAFAAVRLAAGASGLAKLALAPRAFQSWDAAAKTWRTPPGPIRVEIGRALDDIVFTLEL